MDLDQLIAFERIAREHSFSQAAWELGIAQSTISARVQALERDIGDPVRKKYEEEGDPYYGSSLLWDDGIISPSETRQAIGLALSACLNAPIERGAAPVFRM